MSNKDKKALIRLGSATNVPFDASIDIRGRRVMDVHGADLGDVRDLYIDQAEKKLRFIVVAASGFLGIGQVRFILPVEIITRVRDHAVQINQQRDHVVASPAYDPNLISLNYMEDVYRHYNLRPVWSDGDGDGSSDHGGSILV